MEESRKITEDVQVIWKLRGTFKRLLKFEDEFTDRADYILRRHTTLFEKLGDD